MEGRGGLFPFILNTHITSTLFFLPSLTSQFTRREGATDNRKYEANIAHIGEGLDLSVFDVWIAAYESSTFFRNVRPRHQFISQKKESSATLLWQHLLPNGNHMRILGPPVFILVSVLAIAYWGYLSNIKYIKIILALCACHDFTQTKITEFFLSFIRTTLMTYFRNNKDK